MPEISRFFGIVVTMYYSDHGPPHFPARYGSQKASFAIEDLRLLEGRLSPRIRGLVVEWATSHQDELRAEWEAARERIPLFPIAPLEEAMNKDVIDVEHLGGYRLRLTFEGGERRELDIAELVPFDGVFEPLNNQSYFRQVTVNPDIGTIVWPNGADLCPDVLYESGVSPASDQ